MKIEKVNDHQIRCTLTKADLVTCSRSVSWLWHRESQSLFRI
ncbi:MAG: adaptor protein MecA [Lachnospira eligens]